MISRHNQEKNMPNQPGGGREIHAAHSIGVSPAGELLTLLRAYRSLAAESSDAPETLAVLRALVMQIDQCLARCDDALLEGCLGLCESPEEHAELLRLMHTQAEEREIPGHTRCEMFCLPIVFDASNARPILQDALRASRQDLAKTAQSKGLVAADQCVTLLDGLYSADDLLGTPMSMMAKATLRAYRRFLVELDAPQEAQAMNIPAPLPPPSAIPPRSPSQIWRCHAEFLDVRYLVGFVIGPETSPPPAWACGDEKDRPETDAKIRAWTEAVEEIARQALPGRFVSACSPKSLYASILHGLVCRLGLQLRLALSTSLERLGETNADIDAVATLHTDAEDRIFAQIGVFARADGLLLAGARVPLWAWGKIDGADSALAMFESIIDNLGVLRVTWMPGTQMDEKCQDCHAPLFMDATGRFQHLPFMPAQDESSGQLADDDAALDDARIWLGATMH